MPNSLSTVEGREATRLNILVADRRGHRYRERRDRDTLDVRFNDGRGTAGTDNNGAVLRDQLTNKLSLIAGLSLHPLWGYGIQSLRDTFGLFVF